MAFGKFTSMACVGDVSSFALQDGFATQNGANFPGYGPVYSHVLEGQSVPYDIVSDLYLVPTMFSSDNRSWFTTHGLF